MNEPMAGTRSQAPTVARGTSHRRRGRRDGERGAALVEFAIIAPLLFALIFGIIEFGWSFYQLNDVRQSAREGARLAAVNYRTSNISGDTQTAQIVSEICSRMEEGDIDVAITLSGTDVGDEVTVAIQREYDPLTGFYAALFNPDSLDSEVTMRLEREATFAPEPDEATFGDCA